MHRATHDMSEEEEESGGGGEEMAVGQGGFTMDLAWNGGPIRNLDDFKAAYHEAGEEQQVTLVKASIQQLDKVTAKNHEFLLEYEDFLKTEFKHKGLDLDDYLRGNDVAVQAFHVARASRDFKKEADTRMDQALKSQRGRLLSAYLKTQIQGYHSSRRLAAFFETITPTKKAVWILNSFICKWGVERLQQKGSKMRSRKFVGLAPAVCKMIEEAMRPGGDLLAGCETPGTKLLEKLNLVQSETGLLVLKDTHVPMEVAPIFDDEGELEAKIVLVQMHEDNTIEADPPHEALSGVEPVRQPSSPADLEQDVEDPSPDVQGSLLDEPPRANAFSTSLSQSSAASSPAALAPVSLLDEFRHETTKRFSELEDRDGAKALHLQYHDTLLEQMTKKTGELKALVTSCRSHDEERAAQLKVLQVKIEADGSKSGGKGKGSEAGVVDGARLDVLNRRVQSGTQVIVDMAHEVLGLKERIEEVEQKNKLMFMSVVELEADAQDVNTDVRGLQKSHETLIEIVQARVVELDRETKDIKTDVRGLQSSYEESKKDTEKKLIELEEDLLRLDEGYTKLDADNNLLFENINKIGKKYNDIDTAVEALEMNYFAGGSSQAEGDLRSHMDSLKTAHGDILAAHNTMIQSQGMTNERLDCIESFRDAFQSNSTAMGSRISELEVGQGKAQTVVEKLQMKQKGLLARLALLEQGNKDNKSAVGQIPSILSRLARSESVPKQGLVAKTEIEQIQTKLSDLSDRLQAVENASSSQQKCVDTMQESITSMALSLASIDERCAALVKTTESLLKKARHNNDWIKYLTRVTDTQKALIDNLERKATEQQEQEAAHRVALDRKLESFMEDSKRREDALLARIKALEGATKKREDAPMDRDRTKDVFAQPPRKRSEESVTPPKVKRPRKF